MHKILARLYHSFLFRIRLIVKSSLKPKRVCSINEVNSNLSGIKCYKISNENSTLIVPCGEYKGENVFFELNEGRFDTDNGRNDAVITKDNILISEISFQFSNKLQEYTFDGNDNNIFYRYFLSPKPFYLNGIVFSVIAGGSTVHNYYHWLVESLPKLLLIKDTEYFKKIDYFLIPNWTSNWKRQTLELLGIPESKIIDTLEHPNIKAKYLVCNKHPQMYGFTSLWILEIVRNFILPQTKRTNSTSEYVYISRTRSKKRIILNEDKLMETLLPFGFQKYELEDLTMLEQAALFNKAKIVIAPHGAGLGNIIFCESLAYVFELFPPNSFAKHYISISRSLFINYKAIISDKVYNRDYEVEENDYGLDDDFEVDLNLLFTEIKKIIT